LEPGRFELGAFFPFVAARLRFQFPAMSHEYVLKPFTHGFILLRTRKTPACHIVIKSE
jgi:hypothetical protein